MLQFYVSFFLQCHYIVGICSFGIFIAILKDITHFHWIEFGGPVAEYHINCLCTELSSLLCILSSWRFYVVAMAINGYPGMVLHILFDPSNASVA